MLASRIADNNKIHYLDINDKFLDSDGNLSPDIFPDYVHPNGDGHKIWAEAIETKKIDGLDGYGELKREVRYGVNSRIDILLTSSGKPPCYVEVKNVGLMRELGRAEFPDAVTTRGAKHYAELAEMVCQGNRAVTVYIVQRGDAEHFTVARDIDPAYGQAMDEARAVGVEVMSYVCELSPEGIEVARAIPVEP